MIWYWYVLGAVALFIGLASYSCLVLAGRVDDQRYATEREEASLKMQSCDSEREMDRCLKDNSEEKVLLLALILLPKASLTIVNHSPR